jgi:hypothetical protein
MRENPHYGFNSTSQRFSYLREMQKMGENPGPGSYQNINSNNIKEKSSPVGFNMTQGISFKTALHTVSSSQAAIQQAMSSTRMLNQ